MVWFGWLALLLRQPSADFGTNPLNFRSGQSLLLLAAGRNEAHGLALERHGGQGGNCQHTLRLELPRYTGRTGRLGPNAWVRDFELPSAGLRSIGFYFELEAGVEVDWQSDVGLGLVDAWWVHPDGGVFRAASPDQARRGRLVEFFPEREESSEAREVADLPRGGLRLVTRGFHALFLRGLVRELGGGAGESRTPPLGHLVVRLGSSVDGAAEPALCFYPEGRWTHALGGEPPSRAALLARVWGFSGATELLAWVGAASVLLSLGVGALVFAMDSGAWQSVAAGAGMAAAVGGLTVPGALIILPYHGADEVRHAVAYARVQNEPGLIDRLLRFGQELHYETLAYRTDEKLSLATFAEAEPFIIDENSLLARNLDSSFPDFWKRSPVVARLWAALGRVLRGLDGREVVLGVRFFHCAAAALLLGLSTALQTTRARDRGGCLVAWWPLLLFSLPASLCVISNYPLLIAAAGLLAGLLLAMKAPAGTGPALATLLGLTLGFMLHASLNAAPLMVVVGVWLLHRALGWGTPAQTPDGAGGTSARQIVLWWFCLGTGFALTRLLSTPGFNADFGAIFGAPAGSRWWLPDPAVAWAGYCALGAALEVGVRHRQSDRGGELGAPALPGTGGRFGRLIVAILVGAFLLQSFMQAPTLTDREVPWRLYANLPSSGSPIRSVAELAAPLEGITRSGQILEVLEVFVRNLSLRPHDQILIRGFWAGLLNGEVRVPGWVVSLGSLVGLGGALLLIAKLLLGGSPCARRMLLLGLGAGLLGLTLLAAGYWPRSLHARYAMPLLTLGFAVACTGWQGFLGRLADPQPVATTLGLATLLLLIQGTWAWALVERFF